MADYHAYAWLYQAKVLQHIIALSPERGRGRARAALCHDIITGKTTIGPSQAELMRTLNKATVWFANYIRDIPVGTLPILHDDTATLIDALAFRHNLTSRGEAWDLLGVSRNTGNGWVNPEKPGIMRWDRFAALRTAVMGE